MTAVVSHELMVCGTGIALGFSLIMPIGAQNVYIINQGIGLGFPRVLVATFAATVCDALLIAIGTAGLGTALEHALPLRIAMLAAGAVFLAYLARQNLRAGETYLADAQVLVSNSAVIRRAVGASLLNPHAIIDTVGVIGVVAATQQGVDRAWFAAGSTLASLLWFTMLGCGALALRKVLTARTRRMVSYVSAALMACFAVLLTVELVTVLWAHR